MASSNVKVTGDTWRRYRFDGAMLSGKRLGKIGKQIFQHGGTRVTIDAPGFTGELTVAGYRDIIRVSTERPLQGTIRLSALGHDPDKVMDFVARQLGASPMTDAEYKVIAASKQSDAHVGGEARARPIDPWELDLPQDMAASVTFEEVSDDKIRQHLQWIDNRGTMESRAHAWLITPAYAAFVMRRVQADPARWSNFHGVLRELWPKFLKAVGVSATISAPPVLADAKLGAANSPLPTKVAATEPPPPITAQPIAVASSPQPKTDELPYAAVVGLLDKLWKSADAARRAQARAELVRLGEPALKHLSSMLSVLRNKTSSVQTLMDEIRGAKTQTSMAHKPADVATPEDVPFWPAYGAFPERVTVRLVTTKNYDVGAHNLNDIADIFELSINRSFVGKVTSSAPSIREIGPGSFVEITVPHRPSRNGAKGLVAMVAGLVQVPDGDAPIDPLDVSRQRPALVHVWELGGTLSDALMLKLHQTVAKGGVGDRLSLYDGRELMIFMPEKRARFAISWRMVFASSGEPMDHRYHVSAVGPGSESMLKQAEAALGQHGKRLPDISSLAGGGCRTQSIYCADPMYASSFGMFGSSNMPSIPSFLVQSRIFNGFVV